MAKAAKKAKTPETAKTSEVPAHGENPEFDNSLDEATLGEKGAPEQVPTADENHSQEAQEPEEAEDGENGDTPAEGEANQDLTPEPGAPSEEPESKPGVTSAKANKPAEDITEDEAEEKELLSEMFKYMTGADGLPDSGIDVSKMVRDAWAVRKQGKPFPGFLTAKTILAKEFLADSKKLKNKA